MIVTWIKFFRTAISPASASAEERPRFARMANWLKYLGLGCIAIAAGVFMWWSLERQSYGPPPTNPVPVQNFTEQNLQGRLQEARIKGVIQLDYMQAAQTDSGSLRTFIPITQADWRPDDPVRVFMQTHLFLYDQQVQRSGEQFAKGLDHLGLSPDSQGATAVSLIVKRPKWPAILPQTSGDAIVVTYEKEAWRQRDIDQDIGGFLQLSKIFGAIGFVLALIGFAARRSITRYVD